MKYFGLLLLFSLVVSNLSSEAGKELKPNGDENGMTEWEEIKILTKNFRDRIGNKEENRMSNGTSNAAIRNGTSNDAISNGIIDIWRRIKQGFLIFGEKMLAAIRVFLSAKLEKDTIEISKHFFNIMVAQIEKVAWEYMLRLMSYISSQEYLGRFLAILIKFISNVENFLVKRSLELINRVVKDIIEFGNILKGLIKFFSNLVERIKKRFVELIDRVVKYIIEIIKRFTESQNYNREIKDRGNGLKCIGKIIEAIINAIVNAIVQALLFIANAIARAIEAILRAIKRMVEHFIDFFGVPIKTLLKIWAFLKSVFQRIANEIMRKVWSVMDQVLGVFQRMLPPHVRREIVQQARSARSQHIIYQAVFEFMKGWTTFLMNTNSVIFKTFYPISVEITRYTCEFVLDFLNNEHKHQPIREWLRIMRGKIVTKFGEVKKDVVRMFTETCHHLEPYLNPIDTIIPKHYQDLVGDTVDKAGNEGLLGVKQIMLVAANEIEKGMIEIINYFLEGKYISDFIADSEYTLNDSEYTLNNSEYTLNDNEYTPNDSADGVDSIKSFVGGKNSNDQDKSEVNFKFTLWVRIYKIVMGLGSKLGKMLGNIGHVLQYKYQPILHNIIAVLGRRVIHEGKALLLNMVRDLIKMIWGGI